MSYRCLACNVTSMLQLIIMMSIQHKILSQSSSLLGAVRVKKNDIMVLN